MISEAGNSQVIVPTQALLSNSVNGAIRLVFLFYKNLESILSYDKNHFVNSKVVGVVLSKGRFLDLHDVSAVKFTLKHLDTSNDVRNPSCGVWSYSERRWKVDETCSVIESNTTHTTCSCKKIGELRNFVRTQHYHWSFWYLKNNYSRERREYQLYCFSCLRCGTNGMPYLGSHQLHSHETV